MKKSEKNPKKNKVIFYYFLEHRDLNQLWKYGLRVIYHWTVVKQAAFLILLKFEFLFVARIYIGN